MPTIKNFLCPEGSGNALKMSNPHKGNDHREFRCFNSDVDAHDMFINLWHLSQFLTIASAITLIVGQKYLLHTSLCARAYAPSWLLWSLSCASLMVHLTFDGSSISGTTMRMTSYIAVCLWGWTGEPLLSISSYLFLPHVWLLLKGTPRSGLSRSTYHWLEG